MGKTRSGLGLWARNEMKTQDFFDVSGLATFITGGWRNADVTSAIGESSELLIP